MTCPECGTHWTGFIGGGASTISLGRCMRCGCERVVDLVKLVMEKDNKEFDKD